MNITPFIALPGCKLELSNERAVSMFPGEDGTFMLMWQTGDKTISVRLSREAAMATCYLCSIYVGTGTDKNTPLCA